MAGFLDFFDGTQTGWRSGRAVWTTHAVMRYQSDLLQAEIVVPEEFITDLASVPRFPLLYLLAGGRGTRSAVIHDFVYQFGYWLLAPERNRLSVDRKRADDVFHESLLADPIGGAGRAITWQMYAAVRVGGRGAWNGRPERTPELNPEWTQEWGIDAP